MFSHVTVGIDGSGPSFAALRWALDHVTAAETTLVLEHALIDDRDESQNVLDEAVEMVDRAGFHGSPTVAVGDPTWILTKDTHLGELLVIGSHKTGYLHGRVTGTMSVLVPALAQCTTAIVPQGAFTHRRGVVVGVSPIAVCPEALAVGAWQAQRSGEILSLLCATSDPDAGRLMLAQSADLAAHFAPEITVHRRVSQRRTVDALLDASRSAQLLVIGRGSTGVEVQGLPGPVVHEVLLNLNSPVIVAR